MVSARYLTMMSVKDDIIVSLHAERAAAAQREQALKDELEARKAASCARFSRAECIAAFKDTLAQIRGDEEIESTRVLKEQLNTLRQANDALRNQMEAMKQAQCDENYFHKDILQNYVHRQTHDELIFEADSLRNEIKYLNRNLDAMKKAEKKEDASWVQLTSRMEGTGPSLTALLEDGEWEACSE
jgi:actin-related protein